MGAIWGGVGYCKIRHKGCTLNQDDNGQWVDGSYFHMTLILGCTWRDCAHTKAACRTPTYHPAQVMQNSSHCKRLCVANSTSKHLRGPNWAKVYGIVLHQWLLAQELVGMT